MPADRFKNTIHDYRVLDVRDATAEESEGEPGWIMVILQPGYTFESSGRFLAKNIPEAKRLLKEVSEPPDDDLDDDDLDDDFDDEDDDDFDDEGDLDEDLD